MTKGATEGLKKGATALTILSFFGRLILWAGGLLLGALSTYYWKNNILNLWTVFVGYLPMLVILLVVFLRNKEKAPSRDK